MQKKERMKMKRNIFVFNERNLQKVEGYVTTMIRRLGIFKDSVLPNLIYQVNAVSFELSARRPKGQESEDSFQER